MIDAEITDGHTLVAGDFDGDGRDELVAGERGGKRSVYVYRLSDPRANTWEKERPRRWDGGRGLRGGRSQRRQAS